MADEAGRRGLALDNLEAARRRVNGPPGVKYDLGNAGWDSLCVYADGTVYPSAALAGHRPLACGNAVDDPLSAIFEASPVLERFRQATLARRPQALADPFRFLTGGGDIEHAYVFSAGEDGDGDLAAPDPYYPISVALVRRAMRETAVSRRDAWNRKSGYDAPALYHAMGDGSIACGVADGSNAERPVLTLHSNCVLSFDVDKPRALVRQYYGKAAESPQAELCCPTKFDEEEIGHIPREVIDRFYGCGSPVSMADLQQGETFLDLGSGAGIDVFIAAKKVGAGGRAIGVDMTDPMLAVAEQNRPIVAANLGYDAVEFRRGFLEAIPAEAKTVDAVTSNCVVNLSPDKGKVFAEIWRVLKDNGRVVIADIVSDRDVPPHLKTNAELWGECTVGALTAGGLRRGARDGRLLRDRDPEEDLLEVDRGASVLLDDRPGPEVREDGRLRVPGPPGGLPRARQGHDRRRGPHLPPRAGGRGVHRHGRQALASAVRRFVQCPGAGRRPLPGVRGGLRTGWQSPAPRGAASGLSPKS